LLDHYDDTEKRVALGLGSRGELRSNETVRAAPEDVVDTGTGAMLRVESTKTRKYR
jgi:hypothetical protein